MVYMSQPWSYVFDIPGIDVLTISGGRNGGGKTENVAKHIVESCYEGPQNVVCFREHSVTLSESIRTTIVNWIEHPCAPWSYLLMNKRTGAVTVKNDFWNVGRGVISLKCNTHESTISFKGISSSTSTSRGIRGQTYMNLAVIDESQYITDQAFDDLDPTIRQEGSKLILIGNPITSNDPWYVRYIKHADVEPSYHHIHLTFRDNIFFPDKQERRRVYDQEYRKQAYEHIWEGDFQASDPENPPIATYDDIMTVSYTHLTLPTIYSV